MKRNNLSVLCLLMASCILYSSCIGSFPVFNKMLKWNKGISSSKFVNELVFICFHIIPVYEVCYLADGLVFNTIEFWSGKSALAKVGETKRMKGSNGDIYAITNTKDGYKIVDETKNVECELLYNQKNKTWSAAIDGKTYELVKLNDDGTVSLNMQNGKYFTVTPDAAGVELATNVANGSAADFAID